MIELKKILTAVAAAVAACCPARAQSELPDAGGSLPGGNTAGTPAEMSASPQRVVLGELSPSLFPEGFTPDWNRPLRYQRFMFAANPSTVNRAGFAPLVCWDGGYAAAFGSATSYPGMGAIERGGITVGQTLGQLTLSLSGEAEKVAWFRGLRTVYIVTGVAQWRFNEQLSMTVFGSWQTSDAFISPALTGYASTASFGGYFSWDFHEHWGIDAGAQTQRNPWTNRWETRPIVRPYYRLNKDTKFGIDLGGLIYEAVRSDDSRRVNPTIGPPVPMGAPPVRIDRR